MKFLSQFVLATLCFQLAVGPAAFAADKPKDPKNCEPAISSYLERARDAAAFLKNGDADGAIRAATDAANQYVENVKPDSVSIPEAPKPEAPKPEAPKTEEPKTEAPKAETPKDNFIGKSYDQIKARIGCIAKRPLGYATIAAIGILGSALLTKDQKKLESAENYVAGGLAVALGLVTVGAVGKPAFEGVMGCIRSYPIDPAAIPKVSGKRLTVGSISAAAPWILIALQTFTEKRKKAGELLDQDHVPQYPASEGFPRYEDTIF